MSKSKRRPSVVRISKTKVREPRLTDGRRHPVVTKRVEPRPANGQRDAGRRGE